MTSPHHVVLVRPWTDAHGGSGCCSGDTRDPLALDERAAGPVEHSHATRVVAQAWTRLRQEFPDLDVQIVSAGNTVYLLPTVLRSTRRGDGVRTALRRASRATRPGALLVDGGYVGDVVDLGPNGVVEAVRAHLGVDG